MDKIEELIQKSSEFVVAVEKAKKILDEIQKSKAELDESKMNFYYQLGKIKGEIKDEYLKDIAEYHSVLKERYEKMMEKMDETEKRQMPGYVKLICGRRVIVDTDSVSVGPTNFISKYDCVNNLLVIKKIRTFEPPNFEVYNIYDDIVGNFIIIASIVVVDGKIQSCIFTVDDHVNTDHTWKCRVCSSKDVNLVPIIRYYEEEKIKNFRRFTARLSGEPSLEECTPSEKKQFDFAEKNGMSGAVLFAEKYGK